MPEYSVHPEDLHAVADHLALQAQAIDDAGAVTQQATHEAAVASTDALAVAEARVAALVEALAQTTATSRETAGSILWTGPDADRFQAANLELAHRVDAATTAVKDAFLAYRDACFAALADLATLEERFATGCQAHESDTLRLRAAVAF